MAEWAHAAARWAVRGAIAESICRCAIEDSDASDGLVAILWKQLARCGPEHLQAFADEVDAAAYDAGAGVAILASLGRGLVALATIFGFYLAGVVGLPGDTWYMCNATSSHFHELVPPQAVANEEVLVRRGDVGLARIDDVWLHAAKVTEGQLFDSYLARARDGVGPSSLLISAWAGCVVLCKACSRPSLISLACGAKLDLGFPLHIPHLPSPVNKEPPPGSELAHLKYASLNKGLDCRYIWGCHCRRQCGKGRGVSAGVAGPDRLNLNHICLAAQLVTDPIPLQYVPAPALEGSSQGLEADALRCVKWWLRRRRIPVAKEGGYPSVVWTLVVLHVLRCSLFLAGGDGQRDSLTLLGALAAFFDRLAESGLTGTFFFEGGTNAAFLQGAAAAPPASGLSVIDPTTTCEESVAWGITPTDLAPKTSAATQLLHRCELRRAQRLSAIALGVGRVDSQERAAAELSGAEALQELFADVGESVNSLPSEVPAEPCAVVAVQEGGAVLTGLLEQVRPKPGWTAPFLRRDDIRSGFALRRCEVDTVTGSLVEYQDADALEWFHPSDFVCAVPLRRCREPAAGRQQAHRLEPEGLRRLLELRAVAPCAAPPACAMPWAAGAARDARKKRKNGRGQRKACA
ncbi:unnamed protein product [Prorocentrum cordatum]|uniref:Uncharacterized protein n=1 Tax=Prorocentrum cordatum TaxID=2364126 RepID=A0ABN9SZ53_9DINO|nr:unnamed protein product [Polarella glacialis]